MSLPAVSVRRPITVLMATVAVATFGFIAARRLPVELLPDLSYPTLTVQTVYPDAAPVSVEQFVTRPVEEAVGVIPGVREMRSTSRPGLSEVILEFEWAEDMDFAAMEVRDRVGLVELPREAEPSRVLRFDPTLDPIMRLALSGDRPLDDLRQLADRWLKQRLEAVQGVAAAKVRGGLDPEVLVEVDEDRLAALGLTLDDVANALTAENVNQPGGTLKDFNAVYLVRTLHEFVDLEQLERTVVREADGRRVRVEDLATVVRGHRDREEITRLDGREVVELALNREGSANTVAVAAAVREEIEKLSGEMPDDLEIAVLTDQSRYISAAVGQVWNAAWIGGVLAILVLFFFLRDPVATGIIGLSIPVSIVATFLPMQQAGVTLNIMSLGGLALGIGMLVDNSIVVLEAIDRRRREGRSRAEAAVLGASEVASAVTAATLTTVSVFFPIVFVEGIAGQLFRDQALTVCFSLLTSLVVSLSLIPSLAAFDPEARRREAFRTLFHWDTDPRRRDPLPWTLKLGPIELPPIGDGRHLWSRILTVIALPVRLALALLLAVGGLLWWGASRLFTVAMAPLGSGFEAVGRVYPGTLRRALRYRWAVLGLSVVLFGLSIAALPLLGTDLVPDLSQGEFAFQLRLPEGTPLETTAETVALVEAQLEGDARFERIFSLVGSLPSAASGRRTLGQNLAQINFDLGERVTAEIEAGAAERVRRVMTLFPQVEAELVRPSVLTVRPPVAVRVFADELDALERGAAAVESALAALPGVVDVASTTEAGNPEVLVELDRERAGALGVTAELVGTALRRKIRGDVVGQFREGEERLDIRLRASEPFRDRAAEIQDLRIRLPQGTVVPISAVARVEIDRGPAAIYRAAGSRVAEITGKTSVGALGETLDAVRATLAGLAIPSGARVEMTGQDTELKVSFNSLKLALSLAVFLVFVVMAAQFESLIHPFVILAAVPLGLVGVVAALLLVRSTVSVLVLIGSVMLAGIVVNNAIVLVDAINRRRREGQGLEEAILAGGRERLRPILMTTTTTVLGLTPMALGLGAGDELRRPLAVTVIGGLVGSTLLTLLVTPCIYRIFSGRSGERTEAGETAGADAEAAGDAVGARA